MARIGLFYQLNRNDEFVMHYSLIEEERSLDEWIEIFSTNLCFKGMLGRLSLWTVDENDVRMNKLLDNHENVDSWNSNKEKYHPPSDYTMYQMGF